MTSRKVVGRLEALRAPVNPVTPLLRGRGPVIPGYPPSFNPGINRYGSDPFGGHLLADSPFNGQRTRQPDPERGREEAIGWINKGLRSRGHAAASECYRRAVSELIGSTGLNPASAMETAAITWNHPPIQGELSVSERLGVGLVESLKRLADSHYRFARLETIVDLASISFRLGELATAKGNGDVADRHYPRALGFLVMAHSRSISASPGRIDIGNSDAALDFETALRVLSMASLLLLGQEEHRSLYAYDPRDPESIRAPVTDVDAVREASEESAMAMMVPTRVALSLYLSAGMRLQLGPNVCYSLLLPVKAAVTRMQRMRQSSVASRADGNPRLKHTYESWIACRSRLERLIWGTAIIGSDEKRRAVEIEIEQLDRQREARARACIVGPYAWSGHGTQFATRSCERPSAQRGRPRSLSIQAIPDLWRDTSELAASDARVCRVRGGPGRGAHGRSWRRSGNRRCGGTVAKRSRGRATLTGCILH